MGASSGTGGMGGRGIEKPLYAETKKPISITAPAVVVTRARHPLALNNVFIVWVHGLSFLKIVGFMYYSFDTSDASAISKEAAGQTCCD
jgi:hypothetical protein